MSSRAYMLHPTVSKLFVDVVKQLLPEASPPPELQTAVGQALRLTHEQGHELLELAIQLTGRADLGVCPNLFHLPSPYSYTGLSFFYTIEGQMQHITRCMRELRARGAKSFEVTAEAEAAYVRAMVSRGKHSVWSRKSCVGTYSYYFDRHGQPSLVRPMTAAEGELRHRFFPLRHYRFE